MKDKNLFDMLENAEDDTMEKLTENCPEISDAKLEELLAETERRYTMKKKEIGKIRENTNTMNNEDSVSGVDRVKRPSWLRPLCTGSISSADSRNRSWKRCTYEECQAR